jgi:prephenate dehydrogenase
MIESVAIVGLGLMGGSLARALAARGVRVFGYDRDLEALTAALGEGVVAAPIGNGFAEVAQANVVVFAVPVQIAPEILARLAPHAERVRLITDVGSTKRTIVQAAHELGLADRFVGAHPFTGDHRSGWNASRLDLFSGARVFLCPAEATTATALETALEFWSTVGAVTEVMTADAHDERIAWTSHLPQITATALALALGEQRLGAQQLGPGGRGMTRLAASDAEMWTNIALDNRIAILRAIEALQEKLAEARAAIDATDEAAVRAFFENGARWQTPQPISKD